MKEVVSNYDKMKEKARILFLSYDQSEILKRQYLTFDDEYIYIRYFGKNVRVSRFNGSAEIETEDSFQDCGFNAALTIYDLLTHDNSLSYISGEFCTLEGLNTQQRLSNASIGGSSDATAKFFNDHEKEFICACEILGKKVSGVGDLNYEFEIAPGIPMQIRLWFEDDEFAPQLKYMFDKNMLGYLLFETVYYATGDLINMIYKEMGFDKKER